MRGVEAHQAAALELCERERDRALRDPHAGRDVHHPRVGTFLAQLEDGAQVVLGAGRERARRARGEGAAHGASAFEWQQPFVRAACAFGEDHQRYAAGHPLLRLL